MRSEERLDKLDEYERLLVEQIQILQQAHQKQLEPLLKRLAEVRSLRTHPSPFLVTLEQLDQLKEMGLL